MAIIVRIVSADGKKMVAKVLPALPTHIKVPTGAKVEIVDKETGEKSSLSQYVNAHKAHDDANGDPNHNGAQVSVETVQDWQTAEAWLDSMGAVADTDHPTSNSQYFATEPAHHDGEVLGMSGTTLALGGLAGAVGVAAVYTSSHGGGKKDTIAPTAPTGVTLAAADDSGTSTTDHITNVTKALTITGTAEAGSTVDVFDGSTKVGETTAGSTGAFTIDLDLAAGTHSIVAFATDLAGNHSAASTALAINVDTTAPAIPGALDLAAADDSGTLSTDNITNKTSALTITGTAEAGSTVELFDGTTSLGKVVVAAGATTFTLDVAFTGDGDHTITAKATDVAGNVSDASTALHIILDTTPPPVPSGLDLAADDDTGISNSDNITSKTSSLTISGTAEANSTIQLFDGQASLGTVTTGANGVFSTDISLTSGMHSITAQTVDNAGNPATSGPLVITVDTTVPGTPTALDLATEDDNGTSTSDNVTSLTSGLTVTGNAEAGSTVHLFDGNTSLGTTVADSSGAFTIDLSLAVGTHSITAQATDAAGLTGASSAALTLTVVASALAETISADGVEASPYAATSLIETDPLALHNSSTTFG